MTICSICDARLGDTCTECGEIVCDDCLVYCEECGNPFCDRDGCINRETGRCHYCQDLADLEEEEEE